MAICRSRTNFDTRLGHVWSTLSPKVRWRKNVNSSTTADADAFAPIIYSGFAGVINDPVLRIQSYWCRGHQIPPPDAAQNHDRNLWGARREKQPDKHRRRAPSKAGWAAPGSMPKPKIGSGRGCMVRPGVLNLMQLGSTAFSLYFLVFELFGGCGVGRPIWDLAAWDGHANFRFLDFWIFGW